jgi:hypothetical protein
MRRSGLSLAAVFLFSSIIFAQHHEAGSTPSPPPPTAAPTPAPAPPPPPAPAPVAPHFNASPAPSAPVTHVSTASPASPPETRAQAPTVPASHVPKVMGTAPSSGRPSFVMHPPESDASRIVPDQKISGEIKITSAPRVGKNPPHREQSKPAPDLRYRFCVDGSCKVAAKPQPPEPDVRARFCVDGPCACAPGQSRGKNGCAAATPIAPVDQCQPGEIWNGGTCSPAGQCAAGATWNGVRCVTSTAECASIDSRAAVLVNELRGLKAQMQQSCGQTPPGQDCDDLKLRQQGALQRYQMLLTEAGPACPSTLADLASLE